MNMGLCGVQYRGPKNQHAAIDFHAYGGIASGVFDAGTAGVRRAGLAASCREPPAQIREISSGLYPNHTAPIFALGGSIDFNRSKNWAIRLSPDLILEHFGNEDAGVLRHLRRDCIPVPEARKKK